MPVMQVRVVSMAVCQRLMDMLMGVGLKPIPWHVVRVLVMRVVYMGV